MKTYQPVNKKQSAMRFISFSLVLAGLLMSNSAMAQTTNAAVGSNAIYYLLFAGLCLLFAAVYIIKRASIVLDEYGQSVFDFDTSTFKNMSENGSTVTIFVVVIVLIGIYLVVSYGS